MSSLKDYISPPLEAGASIADGYQLPSRLNKALDYASKRLSRKGVNVSLLVIQRDYQLPTSPVPSPCTPSIAFQSLVPNPPSTIVSAAAPPARTAFATPAINTLKQFVRSSATAEAPIRERIIHVDYEQLRDSTVSPAFSDFSTSSASTASTADTIDSTFSHGLRWPASPVQSSVPLTPATPFSMLSSSTDTGSAVSEAGLQHPDQFGAKFAHIGHLSPRDEKVLNQTIEKTGRKFRIGVDWLPSAVPPTALGIPAEVVRRSVAQNEVLFSSENLSVLSLDHLYTFRTALQSYAYTQASSRLEDAVDELRRLILANGRRKLLKSALLGSYSWLGSIDESALADVCRMYSRAYGGLEGESGVENDVDPAPAWPSPQPNFEEHFEDEQLQQQQYQQHEQQQHQQHQTIADTTVFRFDFNELNSLPPLPPSLPPSLSSTPQQSRSSTPVFHRWSMGPEKETFTNSWDKHVDVEQLEIDAVEAWYRDVQLPSVDVHPHTKEDESQTSVAGIEARWEEMQISTPKSVAPPPSSRSVGLRLQTTFDTKPKLTRPVPVRDAVVQDSQPQPQRMAPRADEEEGEMTARPLSAIETQPSMRWNALSINTMSIDTVLRDSAGDGGGCDTAIDRSFDYSGLTIPNSLASPTSPMSARWLGPSTPNGYDDISPITRGEWGFLMVTGEWKNGKQAPVEMC